MGMLQIGSTVTGFHIANKGHLSHGDKWRNLVGEVTRWSLRDPGDLLIPVSFDCHMPPAGRLVEAEAEPLRLASLPTSHQLAAPLL